MPEALDGLRVLDFTRVLAGPLATMNLGDFGADVIKIENPNKGDDTRHWGPPWKGELSAYFASVNRNKRSVSLDLKSAEGQDIARQLAAQSDVVVENFKVGQMASFGLGYEDLQKLNPSLVYCSITGFGQTGVYSERAGYDYVVQAMSGLMSITGEKDGEASKVGVAISDVIAGLYATSAILAALHHAQATGQGQSIDISLLDTQIAALVNIASNYLVSGQNPPRYGNQHQNIVPYQTFRASDQDFVVAVGNDKQFRLLCHLIQLPDLATDSQFSTNPVRVQNRDKLVCILAEAFLAKTAEEWESLLVDAGIPAGRINTVEQALSSENSASRELVQTVRLDSGDLLKLVASPMKLSATPPQIHTAPPRLGVDTANVLAELLGYDKERILDLREKGVI
jgi:crotonobetainyl-CoA:carnitine CoA-transferase CaiB-like acyl-CoA transferase